MICECLSPVMADVLLNFDADNAESDPRNDEDYDTFEYGTEPLPKDKTWVHKDSEDQ